MIYYNECDPYAAQWLRHLITAGELPRGYVDERDIRDVQAGDLAGYDQCHFFAGIGGWPLALRRAGWPDDRLVWTGSCPCQPFSAAGQRKGTTDDRHLWLEFRRLIAECTPRTVLGEQVASKDGVEQWWLAGVCPDLEAMGYECGAVDLPAACLGAPHIRQRLWWAADASRAERWPRAERRCDVIEGAHARRGETPGGYAIRCADDRRLGHATRERRKGIGVLLQSGESRDASLDADGAGADGWDDYALVWCREPDGSLVPRRLEPGLVPLVDGLSFVLADGRAREDAPRGAILKGLGNAIVPDLAALFIESVMDTTA